MMNDSFKPPNRTVAAQAQDIIREAILGNKITPWQPHRSESTC
jgi:hypothetical protein